MRGAGTFGTRLKKCPRCKKHCSMNPKRYEGMSPKKFSKIQSDFFDTVFMSTSLFVLFYFKNVLFSNLKIELYENADDKHSGKGENSKMFFSAMFLI